MKHFILSLCLLLSLNCYAETVSEDDRNAIDGTLQSLFVTVAHGESELAFSLNTREAQAAMKSPTEFMKVIREQYQPLYRHEKATGFDFEHIDETVAASYFVTDVEGRVWIAVFVMKRNDSVWQIDKCGLISTKNVAA